MSSYIPKLQSPTASPAVEPRVVAIGGQEVDDIFETLSSETRRTILKHVYDEPATPAKLAEMTDTSLQNVHYHLEKLLDADLIRAIDTRYSAKGTEMQVYGPSNDPLIFVDSEETRSRLRSSLDSIIGAVSVLVLVSVLAQWLGSWGSRARSVGTEGLSQDASYQIAAEQSSHVVSQVQSALLEPGAMVFLGGLLSLVVYLGIRRMQR